MSISTKRGDGGETSLPRGARISKADLRIEASGCVHELNTAIGVARAFCEDGEVSSLIYPIQRELFKIGSAISTKPGGRRPPPEIDGEMIARLDAIVERIESTPGLLRDWTVPGAHRCSAPFDFANTVCRRAERSVVRLAASGEPIASNVQAYLNRLSDVLWLCARLIELRNGVDSRLRDESFPGPPFSRAW